MTTSDEYRRLEGEGDERALIEALAASFGLDASVVPPWWSQIGKSNLRVLARKGQVVGGLATIPMAQFFVGRAIPVASIAGVAIAPESRGRGAAGLLMRSLIRECYECGLPLSTLYASTFPLYRSVGYERAGLLCSIKGPVGALPTFKREIDVRLATASDHAAIEGCYRDLARANQGWFDRDRYLWCRVRTPRYGESRGYIIEVDGTIEGYAYLVRESLDSGRHDLRLPSFQAKTPRALRALLTLVADHFSMGEKVWWYTTPWDAAHLLLRDRGFEVHVDEAWMTRIVDVRRACELRGYPEHVRASLPLRIHDPLIPENEGDYVLEVEGGEGSWQKGGDNHLELDINAFASLFTGHMNAENLAIAGRIAGPAAQGRIADTIFGSRSPTSVDMF